MNVPPGAPNQPQQQPKRPWWKAGWDWAVKGWNFVKLAKTVFTVVQLFFVGVVPFALTTSYTLKAFIYVFAIFGGFAGRQITIALWKGKGVEERGQRAMRFLKRGIIALFLGGAVISVLDPGVAGRYEWIGAVQDRLVDLPLLTNLIIAFLYGFATYCLFGFFTVLAPDMKKGYKEPAE